MTTAPFPCPLSPHEITHTCRSAHGRESTIFFSSSGADGLGDGEAAVFSGAVGDPAQKPNGDPSGAPCRVNYRSELEGWRSLAA